MSITDQIYAACLKKIKSDPQRANTPLGREYIRILESRNAAAGNQMANNICAEFGTDQQTFIQNLMKGSN